MAPAGYFFFASLIYPNMHAASVNYYNFQLYKTLKKHMFPCRFPLFGGWWRNNIGKDSCIIIIILLSIHSSGQTKSTMICIQITTQIKHVRLIIIGYFLHKKKTILMVFYENYCASYLLYYLLVPLFSVSLHYWHKQNKKSFTKQLLESRISSTALLANDVEQRVNKTWSLIVPLLPLPLLFFQFLLSCRQLKLQEWVLLDFPSFRQVFINFTQIYIAYR